MPHHNLNPNLNLNPNRNLNFNLNRNLSWLLAAFLLVRQNPEGIKYISPKVETRPPIPRVSTLGKKPKKATPFLLHPTQSA